MNRIELLRLQRTYTYEKEAWYPNVAAALEGVGAKEAAWQPPGGGNTIWQTVNHMNFYNEYMLAKWTGEAFNTVDSNDLTFGEPGDPADEAGWQATLERTHRIAERLREVLEANSDADMDAESKGRKRGPEIAMWMGHDAYHTGQIVLIRKMQGSWPATRN